MFRVVFTMILTSTHATGTNGLWCGLVGCKLDADCYLVSEEGNHYSISDLGASLKSRSLLLNLKRVSSNHLKFGLRKTKSGKVQLKLTKQSPSKLYDAMRIRQIKKESLFFEIGNFEQGGFAVKAIGEIFPFSDRGVPLLRVTSVEGKKLSPPLTIPLSTIELEMYKINETEVTKIPWFRYKNAIYVKSGNFLLDLDRARNLLKQSAESFD